jgi:ubiquinol-cytochrome c reductase cytochrome b subunit
MVSAILILALLPLINTSAIRNNKFRPLFVFFYWILFFDFIILGWIGQKPVESPFVEIGMVATILYFLILTLILPILGFLEKRGII